MIVLSTSSANEQQEAHRVRRAPTRLPASRWAKQHQLPEELTQ